MKEYLKNFKTELETVYKAMKTVDLSSFEIEKKKLDARRPLSKGALKSLEQKLEIDEVHNSTAIEGNSLTLGETALVLEKGLTVAGKPLKDHLEVKGYDDGYKYIRSIYSQADKISEDLIREIHRLLFKSFTDDLKQELNHGLGIYRNQAVFISGSDFVPPNYLKVPELMSVFIDYLNNVNQPIIKAALAHYGLVWIHPFVDGNGRTARLLANLILLNAGYPIIIVKNSRRGEYLDALNHDQTNPGKKAFFALMLEFLEASLKLYQEI